MSMFYTLADDPAPRCPACPPCKGFSLDSIDTSSLESFWNSLPPIGKIGVAIGAFIVLKKIVS
jgi:hypothetical protein